MTSSRVYSDWLPGRRANLRSELPAIVRAFQTSPPGQMITARCSVPASESPVCGICAREKLSTASNYREAVRRVLGYLQNHALSGAGDD